MNGHLHTQQSIREQVAALYKPNTVMNSVNPHPFGSAAYLYFAQFWAEKRGN
ncbi:hypothetical protein UFOVP607_24 [uncultured Caudovirales phage]|uniref:Uncharacterized protein n=1 Tax=uncultured Caudovirales phage TaxID=2100421 RepID=A0A6J5N5L4_9CAUD|nr:hypothetical protein UFOVP607_24 [uncultured Caudovirales phage]